MKNTLLGGLLEAARLGKAGRLGKLGAAVERLLDANLPASGVRDGATAPPLPDALLPDALRVLLKQARETPGALPAGKPRHRSPPAVNVPSGAQFLAKQFRGANGARPYRLYVPSRYRGDAAPLIVMLHGCTQSPEDFALGTRMNEAAEAHTCFVAYPGQTDAANAQRCWNWFSPDDQRRGQGEPALIAGIVHEVMGLYAIDPTRVYVAGLSAGGAAAAVLGETYPDLFAAIGVHSGLACGAAHDVASAFAAMRRGSGAPLAGRRHRIVPAIVFHGDRDGTVNPINADAVVAQSAQDAALRVREEHGLAPGGRSYDRILHQDAKGRTVIEQWRVHGAGHAWFGGSADGSYTDPTGPDATSEMLRFFLDHRRAA